MYKFYVEKHGTHSYFLHFFEKTQAEGAYEVLKAGAHAFKNFKFVLNNQIADLEDEMGSSDEEKEKEDKEGFYYAE